MTTLTWDERVELAQQYAPYLVLFPEDQQRFRPGIDKIDGKPIAPNQIGDYHPRGIGPLIERGKITAGLFQPKRPATLDELATSKNPGDQLLILQKTLLNPDYAWQAYFEILGQNPDRYPATIYARVQTRTEAIAACQREKISLGADEVGRPFFNPNTAREDDVSLQYWFCYYFDDWANAHEGDWEGGALFLRRNGSSYEAIGANYYEHENGTRRHWTEVERTGDHPLAYVAAGSHATYFQFVPEGFFTTIPGLVIPVLNIRLKISASSTRVDRVADPQKCAPIQPRTELLPDPVDPTDPNDPARQHKKWLSFPGAWGVRILGGFAYGGPTGPSHKGLKWHNPFAWMERNCSPDFLVY